MYSDETWREPYAELVSMLIETAPETKVLFTRSAGLMEYIYTAGYLTGKINGMKLERENWIAERDALAGAL